MGVAGDAGLARDARPARAGLGEHRHPAQQQVRRGEALARTHEGTQGGAHHGQETILPEGPAQRLVDEPEAAAAIVEGHALAADGPARSRRIMVAQVLADARQRMADLEAECAQPVRLADARQFEQLRRVDRSAAHHHLARGAGLVRGLADAVADTGAASAVEDQRRGERAGHDT